MERLQEQQAIVSLGLDKPTKRYNGFVKIPKLNVKVHLCLDPA